MQKLFTACWISHIYMKTTAGLQTVGQDIVQLAQCLSGYADHLSLQLDTCKKNSSSEQPIRPVDEHATIQTRRATHDVHARYSLLDKVVRSAGLNNPVVFDESVHLSVPFTNNQQRLRFWESIQLSVPVDILTLTLVQFRNTCYIATGELTERKNKKNGHI
eukprot:TRINITY_DN3402_c0_g2_i3.p2 TRINITY_DN3402_c0_g2~~TRINITY_DN3402_c0_g2_i3.p2  ORF type:complete len:161 (-),score=24.24 TRINITY_DN3402_c0_g2_i3:3927-4409(-)